MQKEKAFIDHVRKDSVRSDQGKAGPPNNIQEKHRGDWRVVMIGRGGGSEQINTRPIISCKLRHLAT